jgi:hypothetical protein
MHLDDERIQRLLHDELGSDEAETRLHLRSCASCRSLVDEARAEEGRIFALLAQVDHPVVSLDPRVVLTGRPAPGGRWWRRAAAALFGAVIAGAAYALPGSPLPAALDRLLGGASSETDSAPPARAERVAVPPAGIAIPAADRLVIQLLVDSEDGLATVELTEDEEIVVRTMSGTATFGSDPGRLTVRASGPVRLEIGIPRTATAVEILAGSTPVFRKPAGAPVSSIPPDSMGRYAIPLSRSRP